MIIHSILGIVQGLTEFLPVSSSAHLVILQYLFGMQGEALTVSVALHAGTTVSVIIFFWRDILVALRDVRTLLYIGIVTVLTGIIGINGRDFFAGLFANPTCAAWALMVTGTILFATQSIAQSTRTALNAKDAITLGLAQGCAIIPGISRSGITITSLLKRGVERTVSFRFSFIASIPAVAGAILLEAKDIQTIPVEMRLPLAVGFFFSFATGLFALYLLRKIIARARFYLFGYYCIAVATLTLLYVR